MKKISLCISVFVILFLAVGVYTAQAQADLSAFDGTWLKLTVKPQKGLEFTGYDSTAAPDKMKAGAEQIYACMDVDSTNPEGGLEQAYLRLFDKQGTAIGYGTLSWDAGTNLEFMGYLRAFIATDVTYVPNPDTGFPVELSWDTYLYGYVSVTGQSADKIKIKSISGEGYIQASDVTETTGRYAGFGYILNGGFTKDKKIPQITPACGELVWIF